MILAYILIVVAVVTVGLLPEIIPPVDRTEKKVNKCEKITTNRTRW